LEVLGETIRIKPLHSHLTTTFQRSGRFGSTIDQIVLSIGDSFAVYFHCYWYTLCKNSKKRNNTEPEIIPPSKKLKVEPIIKNINSTNVCEIIEDSVIENEELSKKLKQEREDEELAKKKNSKMMKIKN